MAETDWKPGDVVVATVKDRPDVRLVAGWSRYEPRLRWCELSPRWGDGDDAECWFMPNQVADARPLLVIDPEDRHQVERLHDLVLKHGQPGVDRNELDYVSTTEALRAMLARPKPPKPEEPLGLGAVVVDSDDRRWVSVSTRGDVPRWLNQSKPLGSTTQWSRWDALDAVEVLSQGVTS